MARMNNSMPLTLDLMSLDRRGKPVRFRRDFKPFFASRSCLSYHTPYVVTYNARQSLIRSHAPRRRPVPLVCFAQESAPEQGEDECGLRIWPLGLGDSNTIPRPPYFRHIRCTARGQQYGCMSIRSL